MARSARRVKEGEYRYDDGSIVEHRHKDGAAKLAIKLLKTIKMGEEQVYTVQEIAKLLKIHWQTVLNYIKAERLKAIRIGKNYRITRADLDNFIQENKTGGKNNGI